MSDNLALFVSVWIKFSFVFTPFFVLSMFLSMTEDYTEGRRRKLALTVSGATAVICFVLFFAGNQLFCSVSHSIPSGLVLGSCSSCRQ